MSVQSKRTKIKLFDPMQNRTFRDIVESKSKKWNDLFDSCLELTSLSIFDDITNPAHPLVDGSFAFNQGFTNLEDFITSPHERGGLFMDWSTWTTVVQAARLQKEFGLPSSTAEEMVEQYSGIQKLIGRKPKSSLEYVEALSEIQRQKMEEIRYKSEERIENIRLELKETFSELEKSKGLNVQLEGQLEAQRKHIAQLTAEYNVEKLALEGRHIEYINELKEEFNNQAEEIKINVSSEFNARIEEIERSRQSELETINDKHAAELDALNSKNALLTKDLNTYRDKIRNGSLVDVESYEGALKEIKNLEKVLAEEKDASIQYKNDLYFYKNRNEDLKSKITDLEILLKGLKGNIKSLEQGEVDENKYVERDKFDRYVDYLEVAKDKYSKLSEKLKLSQDKYDALIKKHSTEIDSVNTEKDELNKKLKNQEITIEELAESAEKFANYVKLASAIIVVGSLAFISLI